MKKKLIVAAWSLVSVFLLGAVTVKAVEQLIIAPRTILEWGDVVTRYCEYRSSLPPMPTPVPYTAVVSQMSLNDWSFLSAPSWSFNLNCGTLYVSEEAAFDKKLKLPMKLLIYEDLMRGEVVILGAPLGSDNFKGEALFPAPEWMPYKEDFPLEHYLMDEIGPRRIVGSYILKPEADAWADLLSAQQDVLIEPSLPMAMAMSESQTNDFRVIQNYTNLLVNLPEEFAGATITLQSCSNLVEGVWINVLQTQVTNSGVVFLTSVVIPDPPYSGGSTNNGGEIPPPGGTNTNYVASATNCAVAAFYRTSATSTIDSDNDGLDNVSEYGIGTDYQNADSDNDTVADGWEVHYGFDPLDISDGSADPDGDGYSNATEYAAGADPTYYNPAPEISVTSPQNKSRLP